MHARAGQDAPASLLDQLRHLGRDLHVVDDAGLRHVDGAHRAAVRLELADLLRREHLETGEPIGLPALVDRLQAWQLGLIGGHDDLAAALPRDAVGVAELLHPARALHARARLERAGLVVDAGVDDAAVVPRLMGGEALFLLQHEQAKTRVGLAQGQRGGEADDAAAHDGEIGVLGHVRENTITARLAGKALPRPAGRSVCP